MHDELSIDPESCLAELARRTDSETARVAEDLNEWALRKHHEIDRGGPRIASLDRMPTSSGDTPELWVQLDLRRPQGLQYTFSITADGRVVVPFQYMSAPFDAAEERERPWKRLTEIDGFTLERRLNGRPAVPLSSLGPTHRREQFQRIFSEVADETIRVRVASD